MAGLGHLGFGFAAKTLAPKVHIVVLLVATEFIDILWGIFYVTGLDRGSAGIDSSPWSHGLFMSAIWSVLAALLVARIYHDRRSGIVAGLLVFSHWVVDFITHPMGAVYGGAPLPPDLPLFFHDSLNVGLGLYNHSFTIAVATDVSMLFAGLVIYLWNKINFLKQKKAQTR